MIPVTFRKRVMSVMKAFYTLNSIALEKGDRVDGLWMGCRFLGSHLLLEDIIAGLTLGMCDGGKCFHWYRPG